MSTGSDHPYNVTIHQSDDREGIDKDLAKVGDGYGAIGDTTKRVEIILVVLVIFSILFLVGRWFLGG